MKTVLRYQAKDGKEFTTEQECADYEQVGCVKLIPLPSYGEHLPLTHPSFRTYLGGDGSCYYATEFNYSRIRARINNHPAWATHFIYFGK